jgi:class 3 adenylate cyclase
VAEDVRRSVRRRLLFANVTGGVAVITFVLLASGEQLAPDLPLVLTLGAPFVPAAHLTDIAKGRVGKVLVSAESVRRAGAEAPHWSDVGTVALRGRTTPTAIYEPLLEQTEPIRGEAMGSTGSSRRS